MPMNLSLTTLLRALAAVVLIVSCWSAISRPRSAPVAAVVATVVVGLLIWQRRWLRARAARVIRAQPLPPHLRRKLLEAHPQLTDANARDVEGGLRQFFDANARAEGRFVAMPSKAVDTLWHAFILHTRVYETFCQQAFGRLLHHTPAEALPGAGQRQSRSTVLGDGLARAWHWACRDEGIDPKKPSRLPLLFALDASLGIAAGYVYALDCKLLGADRGNTHCAGDLGSGASCGGGDGGASSSDADGGGGDGGGDGGGGGCGGD